MSNLMLSNTELQILQILWKENLPLSCPEILEKLTTKEWNPNSIYQVLNNMMKKGVLEVSGITRCGRVYGRLYSPSITQQDFLLCRVKEVMPNSSPRKYLLGVFAALTENEQIDIDTIEELERLLALRRQELDNE